MAEASSQGEEITSNPHTSIGVEGLVTSMSEKIENLSHLSRDCSIYRVPKPLREVNDKAYTPRVVSIDPLHHGKQGLEAMEEHKMRYLRDFLKHSQKPIGEFLQFIWQREGRIRECYAETINLKSSKFVEIVLVDAAFIIELFLREFGSAVVIGDDDRICEKPWMINHIQFDLLLLENQIPFFVLEELFFMANITETPITFMELTREFVADIVLALPNVGPEQEEIDSSKVKHLTDFLRSCLIPRELPMILPQQLKRATEIEFIRSATELDESGVKFKVGSSNNLMDMKFSTGVLKVPLIQIFDPTEVLLRNLLAFEQCHCLGKHRPVRDYVVIMDSLINTSKDVELLVRSGVIENWLGDSQDVSNLFNKLFTEILLDANDFRFTQLCKEINDYCRIPRNQWMATLRVDGNLET